MKFDNINDILYNSFSHNQQIIIKIKGLIHMNQLFITARKYYFPIIYYILVILTLSTIYLFFKATSDNKEDSNLYYEISSSISSTITECTNVADNIAANHSVLILHRQMFMHLQSKFRNLLRLQRVICLVIQI